MFCKQIDAALLRRLRINPSAADRSSQTDSRFVLMNFAAGKLQHINIALSHIQQPVHVLRSDDMTLLKERAFKFSLYDPGNIVS